MKHIKPYKIFESASPLFPTTREEVIQVCNRYGIGNYTINDDLSIDVDGIVRLFGKNLEYLPLKFNYVSGNFYCNDNALESLEGSPQTIGGCFDCSRNGLLSLDGCPQTINGFFDCSDNNLESLEGGMQIVGGYFDCSYNELISLKGVSEIGGRYFDCQFNNLTDLEHFPDVNESVYLASNPVNNIVYTFIKNADIFMIEDFVDYEIVRNGDTVMLDRLQTFIEGFDLEMPNLKDIKKHYKIIE